MSIKSGSVMVQLLADKNEENFKVKAQSGYSFSTKNLALAEDVYWEVLRDRIF